MLSKMIEIQDIQRYFEGISLCAHKRFSVEICDSIFSILVGDVCQWWGCIQLENKGRAFEFSNSTKPKPEDAIIREIDPEGGELE